MLLKVKVVPLTDNSVCCYCHSLDITDARSVIFIIIKDLNKIILLKNLVTFYKKM